MQWINKCMLNHEDINAYYMWHCMYMTMIMLLHEDINVYYVWHCMHMTMIMLIHEDKMIRDTWHKHPIYFYVEKDRIRYLHDWYFIEMVLGHADIMRKEYCDSTC